MSPSGYESHDHSPRAEDTYLGPRQGVVPYPPSSEATRLFAKAQTLLQDHELEITKRWLNQMIAGIDDLSTLEDFPTQESIRTSVELLQGLASLVADENVLKDFEPGGRYYERAAVLGLVGTQGAAALATVSRTMLAFENAILELLEDNLRRDDREVLALMTRLRAGLHKLSQAATTACWTRSNDELDQLAHTDPLTALNNRRFMLQELERHVEMVKRYHHAFSVLMLDLDNLKWVNDTLGHQAGDAALKHLASVLTQSIRDVDIACRYGGDEFVVLMPETGRPAAETVATRITESLRRSKLKIDRALISLEVSIGIATCPDDGTEAEELLREADAALYRAKDQKAQQRKRSET